MALSAHDVRRVAVAAECAPRTVIRLLDGKPVRQLTSMRIDRALRALGLPVAREPAQQPSPGG